MNKKFPPEYTKAKWTLIKALIFLLSLIVAAVAGLVATIMLSFPFMLLGMFYLIAGTTAAVLLGRLLWHDYQKFMGIRGFILKHQKVVKTTP